MKQRLSSRNVVTSLVAVCVTGLVFVACHGDSPTAPEAPASAPPSKSFSYDPGERSDADLGLVGETEATSDQVAEKARGPKVDICHIPPGNPSNAHVINVSENAVPAHLGHGDNLFGDEVCDGLDNDCDGEVDQGGVCCNEIHVQDDFSEASFNNNDGPDDWSGPWLEDDIAGAGPASGNVQVLGGRLQLSDNPDTQTEPSAARSADLTGALTATLSFGFSTTAGVDASSAVEVQISSDGGGSYVVLETFFGATTGVSSHDISAFATSQTTVRFSVASGYGASDQWFQVDYAEISSGCEGGS